MYAFGDSFTYGLLASDPSTTAYVPLLAAKLGVGVVNKGFPGATMAGVPPSQPSILAQMLGVPPLLRGDVGVTILGVNEIDYSESKQLEFSALLTQGLLWLTSRRRVLEPKNEVERRILDRDKLPTVADGGSMFVGNCPTASPYQARIADAVAAAAGQGRRVYLIDVQAAWDKASHSPDGIHPDDVGHMQIYGAFYAAMVAATI